MPVKANGEPAPHDSFSVHGEEDALRLVHTIPIQGVAFCERVLAFEKNPIQAT
jgi:hypothetical protein